jgi:hypothetical protein
VSPITDIKLPVTKNHKVIKICCGGVSPWFCHVCLSKNGPRSLTSLSIFSGENLHIVSVTPHPSNQSAVGLGYHADTKLLYVGYI